ncbi:hypothetical protein ACFYUV_10095 [Nonomuraea sp. NPDC003560]|uniref:hypothetical protein n=1 Tax=Nonomuraea sp. NPDC003560 TaxID=3364341 RepID=UPI0036CD773A
MLLGPVPQTALLESWCPVAVTPAEVLNPRLPPGWSADRAETGEGAGGDERDGWTDRGGRGRLPALDGSGRMGHG